MPRRRLVSLDKRWTPRPSLQWVLDKFAAPAIIRNGRMDLLAVTTSAEPCTPPSTSARGD